ncbi:MAG: zinc ribbon domain-containing protein [Verrucomicrobiota bacterium]
MSPEICPVCGEALPRNAKRCRHCGADAEHGWGKEDASGLDLSQDGFDYEQFLKDEGLDGGSGELKPRGTPWTTYVIAIVLLVIFVFGFVLLI